MPLMDGLEFTERLRRLPGHAETPVLFITGRPSPSVRDRAAGLGVRSFFEKPVDTDALVRALDQCCLVDQELNHRDTETQRRQEEKR
jgi:CheY-like chemotaxis protein